MISNVSTSSSSSYVPVGGLPAYTGPPKQEQINVNSHTQGKAGLFVEKDGKPMRLSAQRYLSVQFPSFGKGRQRSLSYDAYQSAERAHEQEQHFTNNSKGPPTHRGVTASKSFDTGVSSLTRRGGRRNQRNDSSGAAGEELLDFLQPTTTTNISNPVMTTTHNPSDPVGGRQVLRTASLPLDYYSSYNGYPDTRASATTSHAESRLQTTVSSDNDTSLGVSRESSLASLDIMGVPNRTVSSESIILEGTTTYQTPTHLAIRESSSMIMTQSSRASSYDDEETVQSLPMASTAQPVMVMNPFDRFESTPVTGIAPPLPPQRMETLSNMTIDLPKPPAPSQTIVDPWDPNYGATMSPKHPVRMETAANPIMATTDDHNKNGPPKAPVRMATTSFHPELQSQYPRTIDNFHHDPASPPRPPVRQVTAVPPVPTTFPVPTPSTALGTDMADPPTVPVRQVTTAADTATTLDTISSLQPPSLLESTSHNYAPITTSSNPESPFSIHSLQTVLRSNCTTSKTNVSTVPTPPFHAPHNLAMNPTSGQSSNMSSAQPGMSTTTSTSKRASTSSSLVFVVSSSPPSSSLANTVPWTIHPTTTIARSSSSSNLYLPDLRTILPMPPLTPQRDLPTINSSPHNTDLSNRSDRDDNDDDISTTYNGSFGDADSSSVSSSVSGANSMDTYYVGSVEIDDVEQPSSSSTPSSLSIDNTREPTQPMTTRSWRPLVMVGLLVLISICSVTVSIPVALGPKGAALSDGDGGDSLSDPESPAVNPEKESSGLTNEDRNGFTEIGGLPVFGTGSEWDLAPFELRGANDGTRVGDFVATNDSGDAMVTTECYVGLPVQCVLRAYSVSSIEQQPYEWNSVATFGQSLLSLAMSGDGNVVATGLADGSIVVYRHLDREDSAANRWVSLGKLISPHLNGTKALSLALSHDGNTLANAAVSSSTGKWIFQVWSFNQVSETWERSGSPLYNSIDDNVLTSVDLSADGFTVALSRTFLLGTIYYGKVDVLSLDHASGSWGHVGGMLTYPHSKVQVSLSSSGDCLAVADQFSGSRVYSLDSETDDWVAVGSPLPKSKHVVVSTSGRRVVLVTEMDSTVWDLKGDAESPVWHEAARFNSTVKDGTMSVAVSADCHRVWMSQPNFRTSSTSNASGRVYVAESTVE